MGRYELALLGAVFGFTALILLFVFGLSPQGSPTEGLLSDAGGTAQTQTRRGSRRADSTVTDARNGSAATSQTTDDPGQSRRERAPGASDAGAPGAWTPGSTGYPTGTGSPGPAPIAGAGADPSASADGSAATGRASLVLTFQDTNELPVANVRVMLRSRQHSASAVSDGDGRAHFMRVPEGAYAWRADAPDRSPLESVRQVMLRAGEPRRLTVRLGRHDLAIAGRVLDPQGQAISGVTVVASMALASRTHADGIAVSRPQDRRAVSDAAGQYRIEGLVAGEYNLHTVETPEHPRANSHVRAGVEAADLVVMVRRVLRVTGTVTDDRGVPVSDVAVRPVAVTPRPIRTDDDGRYTIELDVSKRDRVHSLLFVKPGYHQKRIELPRAVTRSASAHVADAVLQPEGDTVRVAGVVESADGAPIPNERVELHSQTPGARYRAQTDARGRFELGHVRSGLRYRVRIWPNGPYRDYSKDLGELNRDEPRLEITLEPAGHAVVTGRIVDVEDTPIPGFDMWLRNRTASSRSIRVTSNAEGRFRIEGVPDGELFFETRSAPFLRSEGYRVRERDEIALSPVVVDWGDGELQGRVLGSGGDPVAGAVVRLAWSHTREGKQHSANRATQTAADGSFRFSRLGPGEHRLIVGGEGYRTQERSVQVERVAREIEMRLVAEPQG